MLLEALELYYGSLFNSLLEHDDGSESVEPMLNNLRADRPNAFGELIIATSSHV